MPAPNRSRLSRSQLEVRVALEGEDHSLGLPLDQLGVSLPARGPLLTRLGLRTLQFGPDSGRVGRLVPDGTMEDDALECPAGIGVILGGLLTRNPQVGQVTHPAVSF